MTGELFIDESKHRGFRMVAAYLPRESLVLTRRSLKQLLDPGQHRLHFRKESDGLRRTILSTFSQATIVAHVLVPPDEVGTVAARRLCMTAVVDLAVEERASRVTIELDEAAYLADRRDVYAAFTRHDERAHVTYNWLRADQEPLLWVPDAIAWCWSKGGQWRNLAESSVQIVAHRLVA